MESQYREEEKDLSACETLIMKAIWDKGEDISIQELLEKYIDQGMPVVFWACINMRKEIPGPEWKLLDSGETFCWISNEHCMLLVGYDEEKYYFNDPYDNTGVIGYERELVEKRHVAQHSMAIGTVRI